MNRKSNSKSYVDVLGPDTTLGTSLLDKPNITPDWNTIQNSVFPSEEPFSLQILLGVRCSCT